MTNKFDLCWTWKGSEIIKFNYNFEGKTITFQVTRVMPFSVRLTINDSHQAIWVPRACFKTLLKNKVELFNIDWKLKRKEFRHKLSLIKGAS